MYFSRVEDDLGPLERVCRREGKRHVSGGCGILEDKRIAKIIISGHGLGLNAV